MRTAPTAQRPFADTVDLLPVYAKGLVLGFVIAAAIGPIGLLCIRRTLTDGPGAGLATGAGAATADALYASVAAFGLTALRDLLVSWRRALGVAGGLLLVALALRALLALGAPRAAAESRGRRQGLVAAYASTLGLTITNPATVVSFATAFVAYGLAGNGGTWAASLVLGVFSGSGLWWVALVSTVRLLGRGIGPVGLRRLDVVSAAVIAALGGVAILAAVA